jgi:hypothetical protein
MTPSQPEHVGIVKVPPAPTHANSNVVVISNVYVRDPEEPRPERDVAFRCRVRGAIALRDIVPTGIIDAVTGRHGIRTLNEEDRRAAFDGTLAHRGFALLPEQIVELNADRCIECKRSRVSVWREGGKVRRKFVDRCMCQRPMRHEEVR